jgi:phosphate transport system permease protein
LTTFEAAAAATQHEPATEASGSRARRRFMDVALSWLARGSAVVILLMVLALVTVLLVSAVPAIKVFGAQFLVGSAWRPNELTVPTLDAAGDPLVVDGEIATHEVPPEFGALPVIYGTAISSAIALVVAVPLSLGAALFIVRVAPRLRIAPALSFLIEFLAAIPSLAYGLWGLFVLAPFLQNHAEPAMESVLGKIPGMGWLFHQTLTIGGEQVVRPLALTGRDMLSGSLILAIMILPIITAISRDVLATVPRAQIEGTLALGATWWQSAWAMLRYARAGLFGAVMLGLARAAGETMAVTMVIGNNNQISPSIFAPAQTMASLLANEFAEASTELHRSALLYVALILLMMSLIFNVVARALVVGGQSRSALAH